LTRPANKRLILPLGAMALLLAMAVAIALWLLGSTSGSRWLLAKAPVPETVRFELTGGNLLTGLEFSGLVIETDSLRLTADRGVLRIRPQGLMDGVTVQRALLENAVLVLNTGDTQDSSDPLVPADWIAPLPLVLEQGEIRGFSLSLDDSEPLVFSHISLAGAWDTALTSLRLGAESDWLQLTAGGDLRLTEGRTGLELNARLNARRFDPALPEDLQVDATSSSDLNGIDLALSSVNMGLQATGKLTDLLVKPQLDLELGLDRLDLPTANDPAASLLGIAGAIRLSSERYEASLQGGLAAEVINDVAAPLPWRIRVNGGLAGENHVVNLQSLQLDAGAGRLQATGQVSLNEANGRPPALDLELDWTALQWPLTADTPLLSSADGKGRLHGSRDEWQFEGELAVATPDYPGGRFTLSALGDTVSAQINSLEGSLLGGTLAGEGAVAWSGPVTSTLALRFQTLDLAPVVPEWPAVVSGSLAAEVAWDDPLRALIRIPGLQGSLFGEPLSFSGDLRWDETGFGAADALLVAGASRLGADGFLGNEWYGDLELDLRAPGWLAQRAGGQWTGQLELDSRSDFPVLAADLVAENVALGELAVERLMVKRASAGDRTLHIDASGLLLNETRVDDITLQLDTGGDAQELAISMSLPGWSMSAQSRGALLSSGAIRDTAWTGSLDRLDVRHLDAPLLSLAGSAPLKLSANDLSLRDACLEAVTGGSVCLSVEQLPGQTLDLDAEFRALSLELLEHLAVNRLGSTQRIDGSLNWSTRTGAGPQGAADLRFSPGLIYDPERDDLEIEAGAGSIGFTLEDGALRDGRIDLPLPGAGGLRSAFEIDGVRLDGTGRLRGSLDLNLDNLQLVDELFDTVEGLDGSLRLSLALGGVTADPEFDGGFDLSNVSFQIPSLGTEISALSLRGRVNKADRVTLRGAFRAGEGSGSLTAEAAFLDWSDLRFSTRVQGEGLALARLPDLSLDLSPDISLGYQQGRWDVSGTALIPSARLSPLATGVDRVDESPDVVVVAGAPVEDPAFVQQRPAQIDGSIEVALGDEVKVVMDKAKLDLAGAVNLLWAGDLTPTATGEIRVNGNITAWGPRLLINNGRVRWAGETVGNPQLEVSAERDVFGNTAVRTAGVRVSGPASNPDVEAYTSPLTTSERAWAVLLTGSDVNFGQGVGAFDVGTYIAPRIFLSYGISFFDSENVLGIRYDLRRGWGVKATSGQQDSGVDLSYTIEN
jgi:translocation and assembly module TamB